MYNKYNRILYYITGLNNVCNEESLKYSMQIKCSPLCCGEFIANSQPESNREDRA